MNTENIKKIIGRKGIACVEHTIDELEPIKDFLKLKEIEEYLRFCLSNEGYQASGISLKSLRNILEENMPNVAPGGYINKFGYLVIGTSVGGNAVCFDSNSGKVYWADHVSFTEEEISYKDRETGDWVYLPFSKENVLRALVLLDDNIETFLNKLLKDELEGLLDDLD
jgi:hypothetical protein